MNISVRINEEELNIIKKYAKVNNVSISAIMKKAILEKIEDEIDIKSYLKAMKAYEKNPKEYTLDEVEKDLASNEI